VGETPFDFWNAVKPSLAAPRETPFSHGPEKQMERFT
jgi:hypothetical protein